MRAVETLCQAGIQVKELEPDIDFEDLGAVGNTIMAVEAAAYHKEMFERHAERYGYETRALIRRVCRK